MYESYLPSPTYRRNGCGYNQMHAECHVGHMQMLRTVEKLKRMRAPGVAKIIKQLFTRKQLP